MMRVLITGKNSYIGMAVEKWLRPTHQVDTLCVRDSKWQEADFSSYDAVFHVAGIAHSDTGDADEETKALYYRVNRDLTVEVAKKAKASGVKQFIFMSSMIVYGDSAPLGKQKMITAETSPKPANFYGDSKLQAEIGLQALEDENFHVARVRPPMIYGRHSKGNYPRLARLAQLLPVFPDIENERSMLHIDHLCEFIKVLIEERDTGVFFPQNRDYVKTSELVSQIAEIHGKRVVMARGLNGALRLLGKRVGAVNKVFGNLAYDQELSQYKREYRVHSFEETIRLTEKG